MPTAELSHASLHYSVTGNGPPVLGIMGFAADSRLFAAQVPTIAERNSFITFDNRGTGGSSGEPVTSIDDMAEDAVALLDHLGIEQTVLFGASMGGTIAQRLVLDHPERVSALVLAVTFARPIEYVRRERRLANRILKQLGERDFVEASLLHMFTPRFFEIGDEALNAIIASYFDGGEATLPSYDVIRGQLDAMGKFDVLAELPEIGCPTLVVGGRFDLMVPGFASEEIAAAIPQAELHILDAGHALMFEQMESFNTILRRFLDRVTAATA